jgi:hypothetical protein
MKPKVRYFASTLAALFASPALALGPPGHRIIAAIAADNLTPAAAAQVETLLGGAAHSRTMDVASWGR